MRWLLLFGLLLPGTGPADAQDTKAPDPVQPIPVVPIARREPVAYEKHVEPILVRKCQGCHSSVEKKGQLDLTSYARLLQGGRHGRPIVPGKAADSLLVQLAGKTRKPFMPPRRAEPLTPQELACIKLWIDQGARAPTVPPARPRTVLTGLPASVHPVRALAFSPDGSIVAAGRGNQVHLYQAGTGALVRSLLDPELTLPDHQPLRAAHATIVEALAYSPDGKLLASAAFQEVILWDAHTGALRKRWTDFADRVVALAFSPNGQLLATGGGIPSADGEIKLLDVLHGNLVATIPSGHSDQVFGVCFSPDGSKLATCSADKLVRVFAVPDRKLQKTFEGHTHHVLDVAWKADGKLLVSAGADNAIKVWDYARGEQVRSFGTHTKQVTRLAFKGQTAELATCSGDQTVRFWNMDTGDAGPVLGGSTDFLYTVGISPDGKLVAAGGEEGMVRLYDAGSGQLLRALVPPGTPTTPPKQ